MSELTITKSARTFNAAHNFRCFYRVQSVCFIRLNCMLMPNWRTWFEIAVFIDLCISCRGTVTQTERDMTIHKLPENDNLIWNEEVQNIGNIFVPIFFFFIGYQINVVVFFSLLDWIQRENEWKKTKRFSMVNMRLRRKSITMSL